MADVIDKKSPNEILELGQHYAVVVTETLEYLVGHPEASHIYLFLVSLGKGFKIHNEGMMTLTGLSEHKFKKGKKHLQEVGLWKRKQRRCGVCGSYGSYINFIKGHPEHSEDRFTKLLEQSECCGTNPARRLSPSGEKTSGGRNTADRSLPLADKSPTYINDQLIPKDQYIPKDQPPNKRGGDSKDSFGVSKRKPRKKRVKTDNTKVGVTFLTKQGEEVEVTKTHLTKLMAKFEANGTTPFTKDNVIPWMESVAADWRGEENHRPASAGKLVEKLYNWGKRTREWELERLLNEPASAAVASQQRRPRPQRKNGNIQERHKLGKAIRPKGKR